MEKKDKSKIKIVFVEDYKIDQGTIISMLINAGYSKENITVCNNRLEAEVAIRTEKPRLAIVDLKIPFGPQDDDRLQTGLDLVRWIVDQGDDRISVIALSRFPDRWVVFQVLSSGVSFIDKREYEELSWVVDRVLHGHIVYTSKLTPVVREAFKEAIDFKLDQQDIDILALIHYQDLTDRQVADKVGYTEDGIGNRLKELRKKTGIKERHQLAAWYCQFIAPVQGDKFKVFDKKP
jgi:DNA-binding NarL/FixJ family response regulator